MKSPKEILNEIKLLEELHETAVKEAGSTTTLKELKLEAKIHALKWVLSEKP